MLSLLTPPAVPEPGTKEVGLLDRCDRCGFRAFVIAYKPGHSDILFCGHHGRLSIPALVGKGWSITDHSHKLFDEESTKG